MIYNIKYGVTLESIKRSVYLKYLIDELVEDNLIKIGDISKLYNISIDTLRYYDKIDLLKPALVTESGYRYYSPRQLDTIDFIQTGKSIGIPLKELTNIVSKKQFINYRSLFEKQQDELNKKIQELQLLEKTTARLVAQIKEIETYLLQSKEYKNRIFEQYIDVELYTFSTKTFLNVENPFKIYSHPFHVNQWSLLTVQDNTLTMTAEGISLNNLDKLDKQIHLKHLKGIYQSAQILGTYHEIFNFYTTQQQQLNFKNVYIRFDFYFASKLIEDYQYFVTILFE